MTTRIKCPFHADGNERTPSCNLYIDHFYCYGCGATGPLSHLDPSIVPKDLEPVEPEDLGASLAYIDSLPTKSIRGLQLPYDNSGYYLVWPDRSYYKRRSSNPEAEVKYYGAKGHKRPIFWARKQNHKILLLVEGELNALSLAAALPSLDIASPGGAGDFSSKRIRQQLTVYYNYSTVLVIADRDKAGTEALISAVSELRAAGKEALGILMEEDANALLQRVGSSGLREQVLGKIERGVAAGSKARQMPG